MALKKRSGGGLKDKSFEIILYTGETLKVVLYYWTRKLNPIFFQNVVS